MRLLAALLFLLPVAAAAAPEDDLVAMTKSLPRDVRVFLDRKSECHHWAGEEPYDAARGNEIERAIARLKCETLDSDEAALKRRHTGDGRALKALGLASEIYQ
jgi:hypothetical protein